MVLAPPKRWRQIEALFAEAVHLATVERAEFLRTRSDDPDVRRDLERLLAAHDRSDAFLGDRHRSRCAELFESVNDPDEGGTIGPYTIIRRLGRGGMGVVYLAQDPRLGRAVAVKLLSRRLSVDDVAKRRFADEAKAASALDHPRIAPIYELGEDATGRLYIAMAYCEGETLRDIIARGPLPIDVALDLAAQIAEGLVAAHAAGIVHRDIKPGNVIVSPDGAIRIVDFGVAKTAGDALTRPGSTLGTVAYMSPEQTRGERVDPRSDLWSLGVTLYEMLAGVRPFDADDDQALIYAIRHDEPRPVRQVRAAVPAGAARIIARCLTKDPAHRYEDARDLFSDLEGVSHRSRARGVARGRRHGWGVGPRAAVAATGLVAVLAGTAWWGWSRRATAESTDVAASRIAVAPFSPAGMRRDTTLERLGRELVITLSASLDGTAGLRAVEPITILAQPEVTEQTTDLRAIADFARRLGAARVVHGTLVRSAGGIRVDAIVAGTDDPSRRRRVSTNAPVDITGLTDAISLVLLRELGADADIQAPSLAAITTSSVEALREYLAGEQAIARARFRLAPDHFARAIAADSSFWFAYWRYLYARSYHGERVDSAIVATVLAHRHEFPEADRLLIESRLAGGQRATLARRQDIVRLFPNYWPAWFELGDQLTHNGPYLGYTHEVTRNALERAIALNPAFVPAWEHLFWIENRAGDTAASAPILRRLEAERFDTLMRREWSLSTMTFYHCLDAVARSGGDLGEPCADAGVRDLTRYRGPLSPERLALGFTQSGFHRAAIDLAASIQAEPSSPSAVTAAQSLSTAIAYAARGNWESALDWVDRYARITQHVNGPLWAYGLAVTGVWLGAAEAPAAASLRGGAARSAAVRTPEGATELAWLDGLLATARRDTSAIVRALETLGAASAASAPALGASLDALFLAVRGDHATAARRLAELEWHNADGGWQFRFGHAHPYANSVNRLAASRWLLAAADTAEAARLLLWHEADLPGTASPLQAINVALGNLAVFELARIEESRGRPSLAVAHYRRFLDRYDQPSAAHRPMVQHARDALARLSRNQ